MTDQQQPRTAAQEKLNSTFIGYGGRLLLARTEEVATDLGAQIAALRDTVAALQEELSDWTQLVHARLNTHSQMISKAGTDCDICEGRGWSINVPSQTMYPCSWCNGKGKVNIAALESPASAPECGCKNDCDGSCRKCEDEMFERIYGGEASAPEPDPLCAREGCGHPLSTHNWLSTPVGEMNAGIVHSVTACSGRCSCNEFVPQLSPATAHQEPPDAVLKPVRPEPYVDKDGVKITPRRDNEIWQAVSYGHTLAYQKMPLTTTKEQPSGVIMQEPDEDAMLAIVQEQLRAIGYEIRSYRRDGAR